MCQALPTATRQQRESAQNDAGGAPEHGPSSVLQQSKKYRRLPIGQFWGDCIFLPATQTTSRQHGANGGASTGSSISAWPVRSRSMSLDAPDATCRYTGSRRLRRCGDRHVAINSVAALPEVGPERVPRLSGCSSRLRVRKSRRSSQRPAAIAAKAAGSRRTVTAAAGLICLVCAGARRESGGLSSSGTVN
jgi:hypothetical protein